MRNGVMMYVISKREIEMADVRTINGFDVEFRTIAARTPRQTGFNGKRRIPAHVQVGTPGFEFARWSFPTLDEAVSWVSENLRENSRS